MEQNVIQINGGITINVDVSVKNLYVKKIMFGILLHVIEKMENGKYVASIMDQIICDEIIDVKETNEVMKFLYFTYLFINHHYIIDSC